jgi:hypothetical protein
VWMSVCLLPANESMSELVDWCGVSVSSERARRRLEAKMVLTNAKGSKVGLD